MKRLLASDLLPKRAGQPVKALVHISLADLLDRDGDGLLQDKWIAEYRARWAGHRAANSVSPGGVRRGPGCGTAAGQRAGGRTPSLSG